MYWRLNDGHLIESWKNMSDITKCILNKVLIFLYKTIENQTVQDPKTFERTFTNTEVSICLWKENIKSFFILLATTLSLPTDYLLSYFNILILTNYLYTLGNAERNLTWYINHLSRFRKTMKTKTIVCEIRKASDAVLMKTFWLN